LLHDPAIDALVSTTLADNPTLAQALARIDEARATLGVSAARRLPSATAEAGAGRETGQNTVAGATTSTVVASSTSAGLSLSWELDLWGGIRESTLAARHRLDARTVDAQGARLSLSAQVANAVLALRACDYSLQVRADDITSREAQLAITRRRLAAGSVAPVDEARSISGLASARTSLISQREECAKDINALVAFTGRDAQAVRQLLAQPLATSASLDDKASTRAAESNVPNIRTVMPYAPPLQPVLPAALLAAHPGIVSSEREAAAAWAEIGVAKANRLPAIDLVGALTGQWVRAAGSTFNFLTWSIGPNLTAPLFDGGSGLAKVNVAEARYRTVVASLRATLRTTVQDVENALAAQTSAEDRWISAQESVAAARNTLVANEAQWQLGSLSLFELEDARRQFATAQESAISAARDRAQAWVSLVRASGGNTVTPSPRADL
jgi:NodT family efflux transporter outer membrane factor (OMF) lipoprotein